MCTSGASLRAELWHAQVEHYKPLIKQVIDQTHRGGFRGDLSQLVFIEFGWEKLTKFNEYELPQLSQRLEQSNDKGSRPGILYVV